jgi:hypothetical protein
VTDENVNDVTLAENTPGDTFSDRARMIVIVVAILSLFGTLGAIVFGRQLAPPPAEPRDSYGRGPLGHRAWVETMRALDLHVVRWTHADYAEVSAPLFFIEPSRAETELNGHTLRIADVVNARIAAGRMTVLVLPKWTLGMMGMAGPELPWMLRQLLDGTPLGQAQVHWPPAITGDRVSIETGPGVLGPRHVEVPWPQTLMNATAVMEGPDGAFIARDATSRFFVISDPDLLHNFDVQRGDHAALSHDFIADVLHADTIVVDEIFHEHVETRSLGELFARFPGILALAHGALLILVVLLMGRKRFGPPAVEAAAYGRGPREVIEVAAQVLASGQRVERLAPRYVEHVILDTHRRLGLAEGKTIAQKAVAIDALATRRGLTPDAERLLANAAIASRDTALSLANRANRFRESLLGAHAAGRRSGTPKSASSRSSAGPTPAATTSAPESASTNERSAGSAGTPPTNRSPPP